MKKLEDKIIDKVYRLETKKTSVDLAGKIITTGLLIFLLLVVGSVIREILAVQNSFDFIAIFKEDIEVAKEYMVDSFITFYQEAPKALIIIFAVLFVIFILFIIKNLLDFSKIKNKIRSIINYWFNKKI